MKFQTLLNSTEILILNYQFEISLETKKMKFISEKNRCEIDGNQKKIAAKSTKIKKNIAAKSTKIKKNRCKIDEN